MLDFLIKLSDGMSPAANKAQSSLAALEKQLQAERRELAALERSFREVNKAQVVDIKAASGMRGAIEQKRAGIAGLNTELFGLKDAGAGGAGALDGIGMAAGGLPGIILAAAGAVATLVTGIASLVIAGAKFALVTADNKRSALLQMEALLGSKEAAAELIDKMDELGAQGIVADGVIADMARKLAGAGFKSRELSAALESVTTVAATMGDDAANKVTALYQKIAAAGGKLKLEAKALKGTGLEGVLKPGIVTAEQLGTAIKTRFGDVAKKQALGLKAQFAALQHNFGELFEDVEIEPFLKGLKSVTDLLDSNTGSGKALKAMMQGFFSALLTAASTVFPLVKAFIQGIIIGALTMVIAFAPAIKAVKKFFQSAEGGDTLVDLFTMFGMVVVPALMAGLTVLAGVVTLLAMPFILVGGAIALAIGWLSSFGAKASAAAGEFIGGLVNGITSGAISVVEAVKKMAKQALGAFKSVLGIASPSRVMMSAGLNVARGAEQGISAGAPNVQDAMTSMVAPAPAAGAAGGTRGGSIDVGGIVIQITGAGQDASALAQEIEDRLHDVFERLGVQAGAA